MFSKLNALSFIIRTKVFKREHLPEMSEIAGDGNSFFYGSLIFSFPSWPKIMELSETAINLTFVYIHVFINMHQKWKLKKKRKNNFEKETSYKE